MTITAAVTLLHQTDRHLWRSCDHEPETQVQDTKTMVSLVIITLTCILPSLLTIIIYIKIYCAAHDSSERTRKCSLKPSEQVSSDSMPSSVRHRISNAGQLLYREEGRTAAVYIISTACNLICWSPLVISRLWIDSLPPVVVLLLACTFPCVSPPVFAGRYKRTWINDREKVEKSIK